MGNKNVWPALAGGGEQCPQVVNHLVNPMWLRDRRRNVGAVDPRPRPVIDADARKAGNRRQDGSLV
jgi:hypothetical protein